MGVNRCKRVRWIEKNVREALSKLCRGHVHRGDWLGLDSVGEPWYPRGP